MNPWALSRMRERTSGLSRLLPGEKRRRCRAREAALRLSRQSGGKSDRGGKAWRMCFTAAVGMSFYDLFRGFFGFPGGQRPRDHFFGGITREDDDEDEEEEEEGHGPSFGPDSFSFGFGPGGMRFHDNLGFDHLFRDFNALFSEMGAMGVPSRPFEFPGLEAPPPPADSKSQTLRDAMLKRPDGPRPSQRAFEDDAGPSVPERKTWHPFQGLGEMQPPPADTPKQDGDLDLWVPLERLETMPPTSQPRSYFRNVSITKVMAPDGTVEERRTVRDSQGHEETVVSRWRAGEPPLGLAGSHEGGSLAPFDPTRGGDLADPFSILDRYFRGWFSRR